MKLKKLFFFFIIATTLFEACRGYEEGPIISLRTPNARLKAHPWYVEQFLVDNADSTDFYYSLSGHYIVFYSDRASAEDLKFLKHCDCNNIISDGTPCPLSGARGSYAGYVRKYLGVNYGGSMYPFHGYIKWEILKLTNKYLWLKTTYKEKEYIIKAKAE